VVRVVYKDEAFTPLQLQNAWRVSAIPTLRYYLRLKRAEARAPKGTDNVWMIRFRTLRDCERKSGVLTVKRLQESGTAMKRVIHRSKLIGLIMCVFGQTVATGALPQVSDTQFGHKRGFYNQPFDVSITTATPGAEIRFTLDGSKPATNHGQAYSGPIRIAATTVLRVAAFKSGFQPSNIDTQTYIFLDDVVRQDVAAATNAGFPVRWGPVVPDYEMDQDVIGPAGRDKFGGKYRASIQSDLLAIPTLALTATLNDLFGTNGIYTLSTLNGDGQERPISAELIYPDGKPGFQIDAGIQMFGGAFRNYFYTKKHSFRLAFRGEYGSTKLRFPLYGPGAASEFDTLVLRAIANDGWSWKDALSQPTYLRDTFARETIMAMGGVAAHGLFVHLYINGLYWGLYEIVERPDHSFAAGYFGGAKEDWDAINVTKPLNGDLEAWNALLKLAAAGLSTVEAYQRVQGNNPDGSRNPGYPVYLDIDHYIDYMILNFYVGNFDWPTSNYRLARHRSGSSGFRFLSGMPSTHLDSGWITMLSQLKTALPHLTTPFASIPTFSFALRTGSIVISRKAACSLSIRRIRSGIRSIRSEMLRRADSPVWRKGSIAPLSRNRRVGATSIGWSNRTRVRRIGWSRSMTS
jgi:hypothetical protein